MKYILNTGVSPVDGLMSYLGYSRGGGSLTPLQWCNQLTGWIYR